MGIQMKTIIFTAIILSASVCHAGIFRWRRAAACASGACAVVQKSAPVQKAEPAQKGEPLQKGTAYEVITLRELRAARRLARLEARRPVLVVR